MHEVDCLLSTDDEAFTYNRHFNRLAVVQEHNMILRAIKKGVPEERLAKALDINMSTLRQKRRLLDGICAEVAELLRNLHVPINLFEILKKMAPVRQIEVTELMIQMDRFSLSYARGLLAATPADQLVKPKKNTAGINGLRPEQVALMERETANLDREFKLAEESYGQDQLDLVVAKGFMAKLLRNGDAFRYMSLNHRDLLTELQEICQP